MKYPVRVDGRERRDRRFAGVARDVARVLEQHGFYRGDAEDQSDLRKAMFEYVFGARGPEGELERRLNGLAEPLVSDEGKLDSYDCAGVAHEVRRKRGAAGAIVLAIDDDNRVHIGMALPNKPGSQADLLGAKIMRQIDDVAHLHIQDVVLDFVVEEPPAESLS